MVGPINVNKAVAHDVHAVKWAGYNFCQRQYIYIYILYASVILVSALTIYSHYTMYIVINNSLESLINLIYTCIYCLLTISVFLIIYRFCTFTYH